MPSEKSYSLKLSLTAAALALDQRIEYQAILVTILAAIELRKGCSWAAIRMALILTGVVAIYLALNTLMMFIYDLNIAENWWAAPLRVFLYYLLFLMLNGIVLSHKDKAEAAFEIVEWLFVAKILLIAWEGLIYLSTGSFSDKPLFNVIIANDAILGVRFTSSYDVLFPLLVFSLRRQALRLSLATAANLLCETRIVLLLTLLFLAWKLVRGRRFFSTLFIAAAAVTAAIFGVMKLSDDGATTTRLTQLSGSSLDDKVAQIEAVRNQLSFPCLVAGCGLGTSLPGIIRDEARPYSYEAQVPVLLIQGGVLFFMMHFFIVTRYMHLRHISALLIVMAVSVTNPMLFSLASAFILLTFGYICSPQNRSLRADDNREQNQVHKHYGD